MNPLLKNCAWATILGLTMAAPTNAAQVDSTATTNAKHADQIIIAQTSQRHPELIRRSLNEMIMQRMKMVEMAEEALQSPVPEIKKMARQMIETENAEIQKMMEMRRKRYIDLLSKD